MKKNYYITLSAVFVLLLSVCTHSFAQGVVNGETNADGSIKKWHRIELSLDGPDLREADETFRDYRLDVTFRSPSNQLFVVPGFFDGDGDPANSGADSGNQWKARFAAGEEGQWSYSVSFVTGNDVAADLSGGNSGTAPDGQTGTFDVGPQDKSGKDFRAKGKLEYVDEHYLQFANGENFIKVGANSPEVFLADIDFDGGVGNVDHSAQTPDFNDGDPTWGNNRGRGIIGVVNYLSGLGVNSHYFLSMNIRGDGRRTFPFVDDNSPYTFDISKLAQWEIVFTQFDKMGLMVHFQTQETENMQFFEDLEGGTSQTEFSIARRIYYREMVARFGHHLAITWNVGEENNANFGSSDPETTPAQRRLFAQRISDLTPYSDMITIHNGGAGQNSANELYNDLLGENSFTGTSLQLFFNDVDHDFVNSWYDRSAQAGKKWVISYDEAFAGNTRDVDTLRTGLVWSTLMAGGHFEWYHGGGDLNVNLDYTDFDEQWATMGIAANFMNENLSRDIHRMVPNNDLINSDNYAMGDLGNVYLFYLPEGGNATVDLSDGSGRSFSVQWLNTRTGELINRANVDGGSSNTSLGSPPNETSQDWAILVARTDSDESNQPPSVSFTTPANNDSLTTPASVTVDVSANDSDGTISSVELFLNNIFVRTESNAPYLWNNNSQDDLLSDLASGSYTLRAVATDDDGETTSTQTSFTISEPNVAPVVTFEQATVTSLTALGSIEVIANASDLDGSVDSVDLYLDGSLIRTENVAPYNWNNRGQDNALSDLPANTYTLRLVATDDQGETTSVEQIVTVTAVQSPESEPELIPEADPELSNIAPEVAFALPANGAKLTAPGSVIVNVAASDSDGSITNVALFINDVFVRAERVDSYNWNERNQDGALSNLAAGSYTLRAVATDNEGATSSVERTFIVNSNASSNVGETSNTTPVLSFRLPTTSTTMTAPATITATVLANVEEGNITQVDLFVNGQFLRTERRIPYAWNTTNGGSIDPALSNLPAGSYELTAVATSSSGEQSETTTTVIVTSN